jgi:uncharacterized membrane protein
VIEDAIAYFFYAGTCFFIGCGLLIVACGMWTIARAHELF